MHKLSKYLLKILSLLSKSIILSEVKTLYLKNESIRQCVLIVIIWRNIRINQRFSKMLRYINNTTNFVEWRTITNNGIY